MDIFDIVIWFLVLWQLGSFVAAGFMAYKKEEGIVIWFMLCLPILNVCTAWPMVLLYSFIIYLNGKF